VADGVRKDEEFSGTKPVEERHRIDEISLDRWLKDNVEGYQGPLTVLQFRGGQSNPTYRLDTPGRSYVMRRKPFGKLLPSAHAVDREFRVISALSKQGFPVAKAYALCTDDNVIGAAFYIMSMEEGRVFWDPALPGQDPDARRTISVPRRSAFPISVGREIISRARSIAGPSSIARPRRSISPRSRS
jgi:aminoglycoside phosphotransferase (APT) family kinase protein